MHNKWRIGHITYPTIKRIIWERKGLKWVRKPPEREVEEGCKGYAEKGGRPRLIKYIRGIKEYLKTYKKYFTLFLLPTLFFELSLHFTFHFSTSPACLIFETTH